MKTLPDYLRDGLDIVFVGINPGRYSAEVGHYFAAPRNRFWTALNGSGLLSTPLDGNTDSLALEQGIGFTDVVKRPSNSASDIRVGDYRRWAPELKEKLERFSPRIVCFQGTTGYRNYLKYGEGVDDKPDLGLQRRTIGRSSVFVVPNPSPANAAYSLETLVEWYRRLRELRDDTL